MKRSAAAVACALLLGCSGPGGGDAGGQRAGAAGEVPVAAQRLSNSSGAQAIASAPRDAAFTIYCRDFTGMNHAAVAERVKQQVEQVSGLDDFYLVRGESRTVLYHGFYTTFDPAVDRREAERARKDRQRLESLVDQARNLKIFPRTVFEPLDRPDPPAPPEWDLHNATGYWTLLVATYAGHPSSKQAAIDSVREARQQGYEAYFLHKDGQSHVCIGTWPMEAVKRGKSMFEDNQEKETRGQVNPYDPPIKFLSVGPIDPRLKELRDDRGRPLEFYEVRVEILDATLRQMYEKLGYSVNGDYLASEYPLLLEIPPAVNRAKPIDEEAVAPATQPNLDPFLRRY
jgi:hypothetical protein